MAVAVGGRPVLLEDQILDPSSIRRSPGMLGSHRVIDTLLTVGPDAVGTDEFLPSPGGAVRFGLVDGVGSLTRYLGPDVAASPFEPKRV